MAVEPTDLDGALYCLRMAISDLWKLRMDNATADDVLNEEGQILAAIASLMSIAYDIQHSIKPLLQAAE